MDSNKIIAKFVIHYREIPALLDSFILSDGNIRTVKDGIKKTMGHSCPRITLTMMSKGLGTEKKRIDSLTSVLEKLESNNQIVGWQRVKA